MQSEEEEEEEEEEEVKLDYLKARKSGGKSKVL